MKKLVVLLVAMMMVFCSVAYAANDDLACRLTKIENGKIIAETWKGDRYYYVVEFPASNKIPAKTCVFDSYMNLYYEVHMGGLKWDEETNDLIILSDEDWEAQEKVYHHDGEYFLLGRIGADAGVEYSITFDWIISQ